MPLSIHPMTMPAPNNFTPRPIDPPRTPGPFTRSPLSLPRLLALITLPLLVLATIFLCSPTAAQAARPDQDRPPNIVLIVADDLGYADLGAYGSKFHSTPRIDSLAKTGTKLTQFYVSQAVCSASRASLMTGCYANRVGMEGALNHTSPIGVHPDEELLPEILQAHGYATAIFGKWHLGLSPHFSPLRNGFDEFFGIPYSNDNSKYHPTLADQMPPLPLYDGDRVIESDPDQSRFTRRLTDKAIDFIRRRSDQPFFLYLPHVMPHVPIFASEPFRGRSGHGPYGDVIAELDASVGDILDTIDLCGIADRTIVIFTSDNGPFLSYGRHAGLATPLREGKLTAFEGGVRVPCLIRWPQGQIPAGHSCDEPLMAIDLLPTLTTWASVSKRPARKIDGRDASAALRGSSPPNPIHTHLAFYSGNELHAIRSGKWKLHLPHPYLTKINDEIRSDGKPAGFGSLTPKSITQSGVEGIASRHGYRIAQQPQALYDLDADPSETIDVAPQHPEIVAEILEIAAQTRLELGDKLTGTTGTEIRAPGRSD